MHLIDTLGENLQIHIDDIYNQTTSPKTKKQTKQTNKISSQYT